MNNTPFVTAPRSETNRIKPKDRAEIMLNKFIKQDVIDGKKRMPSHGKTMILFSFKYRNPFKPEVNSISRAAVSTRRKNNAK